MYYAYTLSINSHIVPLSVPSTPARPADGWSLPEMGLPSSSTCLAWKSCGWCAAHSRAVPPLCTPHTALSFPVAADTFGQWPQLQLVVILGKIVYDFRVQIPVTTKREGRMVGVFHLPKMTLAVLRWLIKDFPAFFFRALTFTKRWDLSIPDFAYAEFQVGVSSVAHLVCASGF